MKGLFLLFVSFSLFAQDDLAPIKKPLHQCYDENLSGSERVSCLNAAAKRYSAKLNIAGRSLLELRPEYQRTMGPYLKSWNDFAKNKCYFETSVYYGGSGRRVYYLDCFIRYAHQETQYLISLKEKIGTSEEYEL